MPLSPRYLLAVAGILALPALAQPDVRKATWGMSRGQVRAVELNPPHETRASNGDAILEYDSIKFAGLDCRLIYTFHKDKLVRAQFLLDARHIEDGDPNRFIGDFQTVERLLKETYGDPAVDRAIWQDDQFQDEPKSYLDQDRATATGFFQSDRFVGLAISLGHLRLYTQRESARTKLLHTLSGGGSRIVHRIEFLRAD